MLNYFPPTAGIPREDRVTIGPAGGLAVFDAQFGVRQLSGNHVSGTLNLMSAAQTAISMATSRIWLAPLVLRFDTVVDRMSIHVTTGVAGAQLQIAYYAAGADGYPTGLPIWNSATISGATNGIKTELFSSSQTLLAGKYYWLGVNSGTTGCTVRAYSSGTQRVISSVGSASNQRSCIFAVQTLGSWRDFSSSPVVTADLNNATVPMSYFTVA